MYNEYFRIHLIYISVPHIKVRTQRISSTFTFLFLEYAKKMMQ